MRLASFVSLIKSYMLDMSGVVVHLVQCGSSNRGYHWPYLFCQAPEISPDLGIWRRLEQPPMYRSVRWTWMRLPMSSGMIRSRDSDSSVHQHRKHGFSTNTLRRRCSAINLPSITCNGKPDASIPCWVIMSGYVPFPPPRRLLSACHVQDSKYQTWLSSAA